jgi:hypothetical protein
MIDQEGVKAIGIREFIMKGYASSDSICLSR